MWLDSKNIEWERNVKTFPYFYENKIRQYTPDFFLTKENVYVEIKGYETEKDRCKWKCFPHKLIILKGKDLKELGIIDSYKEI